MYISDIYANTSVQRESMQRESFQGVADSDLINARLNGAAKRPRAIGNGPEKLQSDDAVDLHHATDTAVTTADAAAETLAGVYNSLCLLVSLFLQSLSLLCRRAIIGISTRDIASCERDTRTLRLNVLVV